MLLSLYLEFELALGQQEMSSKYQIHPPYIRGGVSMSQTATTTSEHRYYTPNTVDAVYRYLFFKQHKTASEHSYTTPLIYVCVGGGGIYVSEVLCC